MALPHIVLTYKVALEGPLVPATVQTALAAVPLPLDTIFDIGAYVESDIVSLPAGFAQRDITIRVNAPTPAVASLDLIPGQTGSPIDSVDVTTVGVGYVRPPVFFVTDPHTQTLSDWLAGSKATPTVPVNSPPGSGAKLQAYLKAVGVTRLSAGLGYGAGTTAHLIGGFPLGTATNTQARPGTFLSNQVGTRVRDPDADHPSNELGNVRSVQVTKSGRGYPPNTKVLFLGGNPTVRPAAGFVTLDPLGKILSVTLTDSGEGYIKTPKVAFQFTSDDDAGDDPPAASGNQAEATANMVRGRPGQIGVTVADNGSLTFTLIDGGDGYVSVPDLVIFDPSGSGHGAAATVGPVIDTGGGGFASQMGVSRIDVLARGSAYTDPVANQRSLFEAQFLVAESRSDVTQQPRIFANLLKAAIQSTLGVQVSESIA